MRIVRWDPADETTTLGCYEVHRAASRADDPVEPPMSAGTFRVHLQEGWEHNPGEVWAACDDDGTVTGFYRLDLPDVENRDRAFLGLVVHPAARRNGTGRQLLRHGAERAGVNERTILDGVAVVGGAGEKFALAAGAKLSLTEVRRIQYLGKIAPGVIAGLRADAERAAAGYSLASWTGEIPDEYLAGTAEVFNAFNDAPHGEGIEDEFWDAARVRERTGTLQRLGLMRGYGIAALHDATGEMAGFTAVVIDPECPQWGFQQLTAVVRGHRGHRLGLLVKTAMLELLAAAEPQLEWISTGNAAENAHMIAVNEQLGYEVVPPGWNFYEIPVADVR
ncbi:MAG TPA: GNAT family N-acetyltransferase [Trebonia sp.]